MGDRHTDTHRHRHTDTSIPWLSEIRIFVYTLEFFWRFMELQGDFWFFCGHFLRRIRDLLNFFLWDLIFFCIIVNRFWAYEITHSTFGLLVCKVVSPDRHWTLYTTLHCMAVALLSTALHCPELYCTSLHISFSVMGLLKLYFLILKCSFFFLHFQEVFL